MRFSNTVLFCFFTLFILLQSCKKEPLLVQGGSLSFSSDTLTLDTVFTSLGSVTREVHIYNKENKRIKISSVRLGKGAASPFTLNVDGQPGKEVKEIDVAANDSIIVYASVVIDPTNVDNPFVVEDQLIATLNGRDFSIPVLAWGQNAVYIYDSVLTTQTWTADKPYVIINNALVDVGQTLTIQPGARIYNHAGSRLFVEGTLKAIGTKKDSIIFQGDRLDRVYFGYEGTPGEWGGLYFTENSRSNELKHVHILNGGNSSMLGNSFVQAASIQVDHPKNPSALPQLMLDKVTIQNSLGYGILSFGGEVYATNCKVTMCGSQAFAGLIGGNYRLWNCTFGGYGTQYLKHIDNPAFALLNFLDIPGSLTIGDLYAEVSNCIIYGTLENELITAKNDQAVYNVALNNCLIKAKTSEIQAGTNTTGSIFNQDPDFEDVEKWNFHLKDNSPAINKGLTLSGFADDLDDLPRNAPWDLGCYEKQ